MRPLFAIPVLLLAALCGSDAIKPISLSDNFKVVLDDSAKNKRVMSRMKRNSSLMPSDPSPTDVMKKMKKEAKEIVERLWDEVTGVLEKFETQTKELMKNFEHYSKLEVGIYAALAVALTLALRTLVFTKGAKTLDIAVISYILNSPAARSKFATVEPVKELKQRKLKMFLAPQIVSTDNETYRRIVPKIPKRAPKKMPPPPPARPAQVVVDTVTAFYEEHDVSPALHNAVLKTMSPAMRQRLHARRIRGGEVSRGLIKKVTVGFYFAAWYALNVVYNIINKKVLNVLPAPLFVGSIQFAVGALYCGLVWLLRLRPYPKLTPAGKSAVVRVGLYHSLGQLATMMSLFAGPVSFTHIVKAMEPFFSAIVSGLYFKKWMNAPVYATLLPVVGGVGYACLKELNFSWLAFGAAMASNLFFALRAVMSKLALESGKDAGSNLSPPNMFGLVTWAALLISIPIALFGEGKSFPDMWSKALGSVENQAHFIRSVILSGLFHYLNNEVMYLALGSVHPVTLAVGNTMKRVFILVASVMVFRNPISVQAGIGSGVGIVGVLLYSLTKQYYESMESAEKKDKKGRKPQKTKPAMKAKIPAKRAPFKKR